ncbi:MAG TPA: hypothetical protein VGQ09_06345 [Chitinophagaceae bacterium]|nr:hypothetical protein [Chitinophagaceae bacterium]
MIKYFITVFLLYFGCRPCVDGNFQSKFQNQIKKLELLKSEGVSLKNSTDSIDIASETLFLITGIEAKISRNYTFLYSNEDFKNDSLKWNNWYEQNKCKVSDELFDSIYSKVVLKYKNKNEATH